MAKRFTVWVTKCALTKGPEKLLIPEGEGPDNDGYLHWIDHEGMEHHYYTPKEWHLTHESAIKRAKEMQVAKLKSIDKQRARIAALKFEVEP